MRTKRRVTLAVVLLVLLTGCRLHIDSPQTPTVGFTPLPSATVIVALATRTPTSTPTITPTVTLSPTGTPTITPTVTLSPTSTPTVSPTVTLSPTGTPTHTPSLTPRPTGTPTQSIDQIAIATATRRATSTFTPFPTVTASPISSALPFIGPTPTRTPGGIYTLTPVPASSTPLPVTPAGGGGTFYNPYTANTAQAALPAAPPGETGPSGPPIPEQNSVVISYAGQVVPLLTLSGSGTGSGSPLAQGRVFAVSGTGQVASVGADGMLYINGMRITISPASQFGMPTDVILGDLVWSPDGTRLAFRVDALDPATQGFNSNAGVWICDPAAMQSWQIFRDTNASTATQLHEQRRAVAMRWAPNSTALDITVETPLGRANVFMPAAHDVSEEINAIPYADATWAPDSTSLIVSGTQWNGPSVVGRIALDENWTYTEYLNQINTGLFMQDAIQLYDGRIAFLGSGTANTFALYLVWPGGAPVQVSSTIGGQVIAAEWNAARTAVLVTALTGTGYRLWIVRTDGVAQNATPSVGLPDAAHWR